MTDSGGDGAGGYGPGDSGAEGAGPVGDWPVPEPEPEPIPYDPTDDVPGPRFEPGNPDDWDEGGHLKPVEVPEKPEGFDEKAEPYEPEVEGF